LLNFLDPPLICFIHIIETIVDSRAHLCTAIMQ
jgi:hypothetical protein